LERRTETRKRAFSPKANPKSAPPLSFTLLMWLSGVIDCISFSVSEGVSTGPSIGIMLPLSRSVGG